MTWALDEECSPPQQHLGPVLALWFSDDEQGLVKQTGQE